MNDAGLRSQDRCIKGPDGRIPGLAMVVRRKLLIRQDEAPLDSPRRESG